MLELNEKEINLFIKEEEKMLIYEIIDKKRQKQELSQQEIDFAVDGFVSGKIDEAEMASLLATITINGMNFQETYYLTKALQNSGETLVFDYEVVDKHSTGGVSDSTTLLIVPLLASLGLKVAKMSGKSLGHTGGTLDKLSAFEGYNYSVSIDKFKSIVEKVGGSIIGQTETMAPADKKIYDLRSKTATVSSIPLIASSVMSKKLASGANTILLDVKYGKGAFIKTKAEAETLAKYMVQLGKLDNKKVWAVITNMNVPLAKGIGSAYEVYSLINSLNGEQSLLLDISKKLSAILLMMTENLKQKDAENKIEKALAGNAVREKLKEIVLAHGGSVEFIDNPQLILKGRATTSIKSNNKGFVTNIDAFKLANAVMELKEKAINENKNYEGILLNVKLGDYINVDDELLKVYSKTNLTQQFVDNLLSAFEFSKKKPAPIKLIEKIIKS